MKNIYFMLVLMLVYSSCTNNYAKILEGLTKNYVLLNEELEENLYFDYFKITEKEHSKYLDEYNKAVIDFYDADKEILKYLLSFEKDTTHICKWIKTKNPYSSKMDELDLMTNSRGALVLFDNYLANTSSIRIPSYLNDISYEDLRSFYNENQKLTKNELKEEYRKLIQTHSIRNNE